MDVIWATKHETVISGRTPASLTVIVRTPSRTQSLFAKFGLGIRLRSPLALAVDQVSLTLPIIVTSEILAIVTLRVRR